VKGYVVDALPTLRREILAVDPAVPITQAMPLNSVVADQEADVAIAMGVLSFAGGLALLLTLVGLYGVAALWVSQRTREIGIRVALGARESNIVTLVLLEVLRLVLIGLPLGVVAARVGGRLLSTTLYGVSATDAATFSVITASVAVVALLASYVPARRAMRIDPVQVLRHD
jgi:putative ABC transport system permease protein